MNTPILDRMGSDAEFLLARSAEFEARLVPAHKVIGANKAAALRSFIGTDGHNSLGEIRPRPSHHVRQQLYDIASGILSTNEYLRSHKSFKDVYLYASPEYHGETMAGHVHVSFFVDDPLTKYALSNGRIYGLGAYLQNSTTCGLNTPPPPPVAVNDVPKLAEYAKRACLGELVTPAVFVTVMDYLVRPFEFWIQPWFARERRNSNYGLGVDAARWEQSGVNPGTRPKLRDHAWLHFEYRTPSTWLVHPWLAYTYLSLVKVSMLNWDFILRLATKDPLAISRHNTTPGNEDARKLFLSRWERVTKEGKLTRDTQLLPKSIATCEENREAWFSNFGKVQVAEWERVL